jgi:hypothetical protein
MDSRFRDRLTRFTVCKLAGHAWGKVDYPRGTDGEATGTYLRCRRCRKENRTAGTVARGAGGLF